MAQLAKNPPAMWETWVQSLGWEDALNTTPVFWPGEFHDLYSPWCRKELDTTERLSVHCDTFDCSIPETDYIFYLLTAWHGAWNAVLPSKC